MKRRRGWALCLCLLLVLTLALTGCGGEGESAQSGENHFVMLTGNSTDVLDPSYNYASWVLLRYGILETLFRYDDNLTPQPWLAETYENVNETTWRVTVRDGITFSNGTRLTGQAVVDALDYNRQNNELISEAIRTAQITADGQVITLVTQQPSPTMIYELADPFCAIMDVHSGTDFDWEPIGTGPFVVDEFVTKESTTLHRNETYWDGPSPLETVEVRVVMDADTLTMAMQGKEGDLAHGIPKAQLELFEGDDGYTITAAQSSRIFMAYLNFHNPHMQNPAFRQAITMAIDRASLCDNLLSGSSTPAQATFPDFLPYGDGKISGWDYDPEQSRQILADAGYEWDGDGRLVKDGEVVSLRIISTNSRLEMPLLSDALSSILMDLGIQVETINAADEPGQVMATDEFEIGFYSRMTAAIGEPYAMLSSTFGTDGYANYGHYSNPQVDQLLEQLAVEYDPDARTQLAIEIQQLTTDDVAVLNFCHLDLFLLSQSNVTGVTANPSDFYILTNRLDKT